MQNKRYRREALLRGQQQQQHNNNTSNSNNSNNNQSNKIHSVFNNHPTRGARNKIQKPKHTAATCCQQHEQWPAINLWVHTLATTTTATTIKEIQLSRNAYENLCICVFYSRALCSRALRLFVSLSMCEYLTARVSMYLCESAP